MIQPRSCALFLLVVSVLTCPLFAAPGEEVQKQLQQTIAGKLLFLRSPVIGSELRYDSAGQPVNKLVPGGWAAYAAIKIGKVRFRDGGLNMEGSRYVMYYDKEGKLQSVSTREKVRVSVLLDASADQAAAMQKLNKVFYPEGDSAAILPSPTFGTVPDSKYEFCEMKEQHTGFREKAAGACRAPGRILDPIVVGGLPDGQKIYIPTAGMIMATPEGGSRTDAFLSLLHEVHRGNLFYALITVDKWGRVAGVKVKDSMGANADSQLAAMIAKWKYAPAELQGVSVASIATIRGTSSSSMH